MDVLTLVAQKLSLADRVKMAGICSAWRWAALGGSRSPFDDEGDGKACQCLKGDREAVFKRLKSRGGIRKTWRVRGGSAGLCSDCFGSRLPRRLRWAW